MQQSQMKANIRDCRIVPSVYCIGKCGLADSQRLIKVSELLYHQTPDGFGHRTGQKDILSSVRLFVTWIVQALSTLKVFVSSLKLASDEMCVAAIAISQYHCSSVTRLSSDSDDPSKFIQCRDRGCSRQIKC